MANVSCRDNEAYTGNLDEQWKIALAEMRDIHLESVSSTGTNNAREVDLTTESQKYMALRGHSRNQQVFLEEHQTNWHERIDKLAHIMLPALYIIFLVVFSLVCFFQMEQMS